MQKLTELKGKKRTTSQSQLETSKDLLIRKSSGRKKFGVI